MNKLLIVCAMLIPVVGCTGIAGDGSNLLGFAGNGTDSGGSASDMGAGGSSSASSAGSPAGGSGTPVGVGTGGTNPTGTGGASAVGGTSNGGTSNGGACTVDALPSGVQAMLNNGCNTCHGAVPLAGLPSLVSYANLTAPSKTDPSKTNAVLALARIQSTSTPMPPAPGARASAADIAALQAFVSAGYPKASCPTGTGGAGGTTGGGGAAGGGTGGFDPLHAMPTCTTMTSWTGGNRGSGSMNPGLACISCHSSGEGPRFSIAGTVYATGHEPDRCNSMVGTAGATIVIIGADGKQLTLTPNGVGNFSSNTAVKTPFQAKVTYQGRERLMLTPQTSGDCNSCHTQNGTMNAPGRVTIP